MDNLLASDYPYAKLHLLTWREDGQQRLLFALLELLPHGFLAAEEVVPKSWNAGKKRSVQHGVIPLPFSQAWQWYTDMAKGKGYIPVFAPEKAEQPLLSAGPFGAEPAFPHLSTGG